MAGKKSTKGSWFKKLLVFLNILAVLALLASYAALFTDPRSFWPPAFAGLAYPLILIANLVFVLAWLVSWKKYIFLSLIPILAGWTQLMTLVPVRVSKPDPALPGSLKVITYNIHGFNYSKSDNTVMQKQILNFLKMEKPSVVCFQEFKPRGGATVGSLGDSIGLPSYYRKNYLEYKDPEVIYGIVIYSKHPILQTGYLRDERNRVFAIWADINDRKNTYRIYNCHLVSVRFGTKEYSFYEDLKNQATENLDLKEGAFNILKKLKRAFIIRSGQVEKVVASVRKSPYPVILAGDLNDSPFSYCYHQLTRDLKDSYREAGSGWVGNTFAGQLPSYRIDYILHSKNIDAVQYTKHETDYSDHYPVSSTLNNNK
jgi:endonuclease/exonuclease/phosphatase family metal-dependent hydrolase